MHWSNLAQSDYRVCFVMLFVFVSLCALFYFTFSLWDFYLSHTQFIDYQAGLDQLVLRTGLVNADALCCSSIRNCEGRTKQCDGLQLLPAIKS